MAIKRTVNSADIFNFNAKNLGKNDTVFMERERHSCY